MVDQSFMDELIKEVGNEFGGMADDETKFRETQYIDTGSYALNALLSGSIYGGSPDDKVVGYAGEEATGKTYFTLAELKFFLDSNPNAMGCLFESEHSTTPKVLKARGIDPKRVAIFPVGTVEEFKTQAARFLDAYSKKPVDKRPPVMFILDSLGNLSTEKEIAETVSGDNKRDMTRSQLIRAAFRVLTLKMGLVNVGFKVTNHIYQKTGVSFGDPREVAGGGGMKYAASIILMLSKAQHKEGTEVKGAVITATLMKGRETREKLKVKVLLHHEKGLDRYYGLLEIAEKAGVFQKIGNKYKLPDGTSQFGKTIEGNPTKFFTKDVLDQIDAWTKENFRYSGGMDEQYEDDDSED